jgi:hypothetical protein
VQLEEDLRTLRTEVMRSGDNSVQLPVNFKRLIWNAQQMFRCHPHRPGASGNSDTLTAYIAAAASRLLPFSMSSWLHLYFG